MQQFFDVIKLRHQIKQAQNTMIKFISTRTESKPEYEMTETGDYQEVLSKAKRDAFARNDTSRVKKLDSSRKSTHGNQRDGRQSPALSNRSGRSNGRAKGTKHIDFNVTTTYKPPTV